MKKIVPFKKEIKLENDFEEILSIALEHTYKKEEFKIYGDFIVNGEYKSNKDNKPFEYKIPFQINLDEKYNLDNIEVTIDDFYYELGKENKLIISIELSIENLEERCVEEEDLFKETSEKVELKTESINEDSKDKYTTYKVYIVEENDTVESICTKYNILKEDLEKYNDLNNFKMKDKIIIPYIFDEKN